MSNVQLVFLTTGEQLVGDYKESADGSTVWLENPLMVMQVDAQKLGFVDYLQLTGDKTVQFDMKRDIRHVLPPNQDIVNYWLSLYSGIILGPGASRAEIITG